MLSPLPVFQENDDSHILIGALGIPGSIIFTFQQLIGAFNPIILSQVMGRSNTTQIWVKTNKTISNCCTPGFVPSIKFTPIVKFPPVSLPPLSIFKRVGPHQNSVEPTPSEYNHFPRCCVPGDKLCFKSSEAS